jgi:hypothetical protein
MPYTFCGGGSYLRAKSGLADDFLLNFFPITPPENRNVARGYRDLGESDFIVSENSPPPKKNTNKFLKK